VSEETELPGEEGAETEGAAAEEGVEGAPVDPADPAGEGSEVEPEGEDEVA